MSTENSAFGPWHDAQASPNGAVFEKACAAADCVSWQPRHAAAEGCWGVYQSRRVCVGSRPGGVAVCNTLDESADLFLDTRGWGKGYAWVNGFFLGRYWRRGPQRTLYVPGPVTRAGENHVVIVELEAVTDATARFVARPDLGHEVE